MQVHKHIRCINYIPKREKGQQMSVQTITKPKIPLPKCDDTTCAWNNFCGTSTTHLSLMPHNLVAVVSTSIYEVRVGQPINCIISTN